MKYKLPNLKEFQKGYKSVHKQPRQNKNSNINNNKHVTQGKPNQSKRKLDHIIQTFKHWTLKI